MSERDPFLDAVLAEPEDDAVRLIYADWLEERGDPRGPFVRAQVRLAGLPEDDPARPDLDEQARDLLREHEEEWAAGLPGKAAAWEFRRGFVERLTLTDEALLEHGDFFGKTLPLRGLTLTTSGRLDRVADLPLLHRIEALSLPGTAGNWPWERTGVCHFGALVASPYLGRLRDLSVTDGGMSPANLQLLAESPVLPRLRRLDLSRNTGVGPSSGRLLAVSALSGLEELLLSDTRVGLPGTTALLGSRHLTRLRRLELARADLRESQGALARALASWIVWPRLAALDLGQCYGAGEPLRAFLRSGRASGLRELRLGNCELGPAAVEALAATASPERLAWLDLGDNGLDHAAARTLADAPAFAGLTRLYLGGNPLRDRGVKALAASPHLRRLRLLDLHKTEVGGPGVQALTALSELTDLNLADNYVGLSTVQALATSPLLTRLTRLNLHGHSLDASAAVVLARSPTWRRLAALDLGGNRLGDAGLRVLAAAPLARLDELVLNANGIGVGGADAAAAVIEGSPVLRRLRRLDLTANSLSDAEKERLRQRFGPRLAV
jgi:uncharacterized protein (TIGR02996 family)